MVQKHKTVVHVIAAVSSLIFIGVPPSAWTRYEAQNIESSIRKKQGIP